MSPKVRGFNKAFLNNKKNGFFCYKQVKEEVKRATERKNAERERKVSTPVKLAILPHPIVGKMQKKEGKVRMPVKLAAALPIL